MKPRGTLAAAVLVTAGAGLSGCSSGDDFTPAAGNSKAGPFEVIGEPVASFDARGEE